MPFCQCDDRPASLRTRLETSLVRLHRALRNNSRRTEALDSMFAEWQTRWASRREDMVRRLEAIDSQLDVWESVSAPRLAVIGDSDDMHSDSAPGNDWMALITND